MKIYVPPIPNKKFQFKGEWQTVLLNGISLNERVSLCDSEAEADIIVLDFRHVDNDCRVSSPQKTVLLDYRDHRDTFDVDVCLYFKRSVVSAGKFVKYNRDDPSDLHQKLKHYLNNPDEGLKIAEAGYRHARRYHTAASRIDEVLDEFAARQSARSSRSGALLRSISKAIGFCRAWAQRRYSRHATRY